MTATQKEIKNLYEYDNSNAIFYFVYAEQLFKEETQKGINFLVSSIGKKIAEKLGKEKAIEVLTKFKGCHKSSESLQNLIVEFVSKINYNFDFAGGTLEIELI